MIQYVRGDLLTADTDALVNLVNCVGIMGRGLALHFKGRWPANFSAYAAACRKGEVQPGRMFVHERPDAPRFVINFPTKRHWRDKSQIEDIASGLDALVQVLQERRIRSVAVPALGAGLGGLSWNDVRPLIERALSSFNDTQVLIYEPIES